jgi:hypothetical protein
MASLDQARCNRAADKTGRAGDEYFHVLLPDSIQEADSMGTVPAHTNSARIKAPLRRFQ